MTAFQIGACACFVLAVLGVVCTFFSFWCFVKYEREQTKSSITIGVCTMVISLFVWFITIGTAALVIVPHLRPTTKGSGQVKMCPMN